MFKKLKKLEDGHAYQQAGFTLLELLVVIGIIGLLASIIVINLTGARKRARDTKRIADVRTMQTAMEDYYGKNAKYPTIIGNLVTGGEISIWPQDPLAPSGTVCTGNSDNCYYYAYYTPVGTVGPQSYHIGASLEDTTSLVLNQDRDCTSTTGGGCPYNNAYTTGFAGADTASCGGVAGKACYDIAQ
ncbi:MAG: type II secretion system protein [Candidatus Azambacteria bacterium]|nr:type II secretion system protein [Candidatus Azambacteria bacterium]